MVGLAARDLTGTADPVLSRSGMAGIIAAAQQAAGALGVPVLIEGEPGTGSEPLARYIDQHGASSTGDFIAIGCRGVPEGKMHAALIGATGCDPAPRSLFIEEVGYLGPAAQAHLVTLLDRSRQALLGDGPAYPTRVICATALNLRKRVGERSFRLDLLDRLSTVKLQLPPLRSCPADIVPLAERFLVAAARAFGKAVGTLSAGARERLLQHPWPGNCDELKVVIERALVLRVGDTIAASTIAFDEMIEETRRLFEAFAGDSAQRGRPATLDEIERAYVQWSLEQTSGNRTAASRLLGVSYPTLKKKMRDYGIDAVMVKGASRRLAGGGGGAAAAHLGLRRRLDR